jgi:NTE family protein
MVHCNSGHFSVPFLKINLMRISVDQRIIRKFFSLLLMMVCIVFLQTAAQSQSRMVIIHPDLLEAPLRYPHLNISHPVQHPRLAVVLSGGGARGVAAIGVLRALERAKIPIDLIVGTSMGSVIGGLYAMGYSTEQLQQLIDTTNWEDLLSYTDEARRRDMFLDQKIARDKSVLVLRFEGLTPVIPEAFSTGQRLTNFLNTLTLQALYKPESNFDDFRIPFRAVATDLVSGKRIVLDRGDVTEALRASLSVPLLFSSIPRDSLQLLDGGLVDNLPVDVALAHRADIVIAVDMVSPLRPKDQLNAPWEIADQITTIMMQEATRAARTKANIVLDPKIGDHLSSDFTGLDSLITAGERAADESIPLVMKFIKEYTLKEYQADSAERYTYPRFSWTSDLPLSYKDTLRFYENRGWVSKRDLQILVNDLYTEGDYAIVEGIVRQAGDSSALQISLSPNPLVRGSTMTGNHIFSSDTLTSFFRPMVGYCLNAKRITAASEQLLAMYRKSGYPLARIFDTQFDSTSGCVNIVLDEGVVSRTDIQGTKKTRDWVLRRELPWHENDLLTLAKISQGMANLYGTELFEQMHFSVHHEGDSSQWNVTTIHAHERNTELIRFGLRVDDERDIQPSIDVRDENLFGAGAEIGLFVGGGTRNQSYVGELKATRIFNSYLTFNFKGYSIVRNVNYYTDGLTNDSHSFERNRVGEYRERRNGGLMSFGAQLERLGSVTVEGRLEQINVDNIFNEPIVNQKYNISSIRFGTNVDTQDKIPYPTDGVIINFSYESALVKFVNAIGFTKMFFSYDTYRTMHKGHVIHPRFMFGFADETLPISEQFSLGGQQNFFGFREDNARGRQLFIASLEYQYKMPFELFFDTYFKARYDFGSVWTKTEEMRLVDFKHGIGITIGLDTPIGPAEISLGRGFSVNKLFSNHPLSFGPFIGYFSVGFPVYGVVRN